MPNMTPEMHDQIENAFPNIFNHYVSPDVSDATPQYNCIAWAYGTDQERFWPAATVQGYVWPDGISDAVTLQSFIDLFSSIGYLQTNDASFEQGYLKIAIFTNNGVPTHAARQLPDQNWTSKLGGDIDISHTIEGMNNGFYGDATVFMRRAI